MCLHNCGMINAVFLHPWQTKQRFIMFPELNCGARMYSMISLSSSKGIQCIVEVEVLIYI